MQNLNLNLFIIKYILKKNCPVELNLYIYIYIYIYIYSFLKKQMRWYLRFIHKCKFEIKKYIYIKFKNK